MNGHAPSMELARALMNFPPWDGSQGPRLPVRVHGTRSSTVAYNSLTICENDEVECFVSKEESACFRAREQIIAK